MHSLGLCLDALTPGKIMLDEHMWITCPVLMSSRMCFAAEATMQQASGDDTGDEEIRGKYAEVLGVCRGVDHDVPLTVQWVTGRISNFEYLMALNYAAGRSMVDPLYHPILPWVTNFIAEVKPHNRSHVLRDLTRSKFRLSKGDAQLHTTFMHSEPPHHIPDALSELTYFIYMARCTPMQVLQRVVRNDFVAEHYPRSIQKMFEWTPDECIPEFYMDASVFKSIHTDRLMDDLELPQFASTPAAFLAYHRQILESDDVSKNLHHWINLTFGYCLQGEDAVRNLNVPLRHCMSSNEKIGDSAKLDKHPGFVVLFRHPHPMRRYRQFSSSTNTPKSSYEPSLQQFLDLDREDNRSQRKLMKYVEENIVSPVVDMSPTESDLDTILKFSKPLRICGYDTSEYNTVDAYKFAARYGTFLEACYQVPAEGDVNAVSMNNWDDEFRCRMGELACTDSWKADLKECNTADAMQWLQAQDLFSLGCIFAELYTGQPLLDHSIAEDVSALSHRLREYFNSVEPLPLPVQRLVCLLTNPTPQNRPNAFEVLRTCFFHTSEYIRTFPPDPAFDDVVEMFDQPVPPQYNLNRQRLNILQDYCQYLFPSYFKATYKFIGELKLAPTSLAKLKYLTKHAAQISEMPLEGLGLTLPHILDIIRDPQSFRDELGALLRANLQTYSCSEGYELELKSIVEYVAVVDALGCRLGIDSTERIIVPRIIEFLSKLKSQTLLQSIIRSTLWKVLIQRAGPKCFLRQFLPLLLTYVSCGTLRNVSLNASGYESGVSPLWAAGGAHPEKSDWLHSSASIGLRDVQESAVVALSSLALPDALGPGLCIRYVLPALLCLVGVPQLATTGYQLNAGEDYDATMLHLRHDFITRLAEYRSDDMFVIHSILGICSHAGDIATTGVVLPKIFGDILPALEVQLHTRPTTGTYAALLELFFLLIGLLPMASVESVRKHYFLSPKESGEYSSLLKILITLPLPTLVRPSACNGMPGYLQSLVDFRRRHFVFMQLCKLISSASMYVGNNNVMETVLPVVDAFFESFVDTYRTKDVESEEMTLAFQLGVELFVPLAQQVGPEAFSTCVHHVNPRLEMWLMSTASGAIGKSPPLPSNILPEELSGAQDTLTPALPDERSSIFTKWLAAVTPGKRVAKEDRKKTGTVVVRPEIVEIETPATEASSIDEPKYQFYDGSSDDDEDVAEDDISCIKNIPVPPINLPIQRLKSESDASLGTPTSVDYEYTLPKLLESLTDMELEDIETIHHNIRTARADSTAVRSTSIFTPSRSSKDAKRNINSLPHKTKSPEHFFNSTLLSQAKSHLRATKGQLRKHVAASLLMSSNFADKSDAGGDSDCEDDANLLRMHSDLAWLLGGSGRWRVVSDSELLGLPSDKPKFPEKMPPTPSSSKSKPKQPAAQISMTSPKIAVDTASEAVSLFALSMCNKSSWVADELPGGVITMLANPLESLLLTGSFSGAVKIWNINAHPVHMATSYTAHSSAIRCASFMRNGMHVASCDGSIHLWDVETSRTVGSIWGSRDNNLPFAHMHAISPREGVSPDINYHGDDQIVTCTGPIIASYDFRVHSSSPLKSIADWKVFTGNTPMADMSPHLCTAASHEQYTFVGSMGGNVWAVDRRSGRTMFNWQAHDSAVLKVSLIRNQL